MRHFQFNRESPETGPDGIRIMRLVGLIFILPGILLLPVLARAQTDHQGVGEGRRWIRDMKASPRGPFKGINWFCNDGTIQSPEPYSCRDHGGGVQHGDWSDRTKTLRSEGYYIATILAGINADEIIRHPGFESILKQMIMEQFLIEADDGWIFRRARFYRGALQEEGEKKGGRNLLLALLQEPQWKTDRFLVLREAVRGLPHDRQGAPLTEMRQLTLSIAEKDESFHDIRTKIHVRPDAQDAKRVRTYASTEGISEMSAEYAKLAQLIEAVYSPQDIGSVIDPLLRRITDEALIKTLKEKKKQLSDRFPLAERYGAACDLLALFRKELPRPWTPRLALSFLDASIILENEVFRLGNALMPDLPKMTRKQRLDWLGESLNAVFGVGLISEREWNALKGSLTHLTRSPLLVGVYQEELNYLSLTSEWAVRQAGFHFSETIKILSEIEPLSKRYIPDRLHGSPLQVYAGILETLIRDMNRMVGMRHELFGNSVYTGLRGLNPGLARGILRFPVKGDETLDRKGIYVLHATTEDLPPVGGIVTAGYGNILSHVQLLARNLGIPNVAIDEDRVAFLKAWEGHRVVLSVSPLGVVSMVEDGPEWENLFDGQTGPTETLIRSDFNKLDLDTRTLISLRNIRASDSGRLAGPKAANLGELKYRFPEAVTEGLVIPFGVFRQLLDQPISPEGPSVYKWMQDQYAVIRDMGNDPEKKKRATLQFLAELRDWITKADPGSAFREELHEAMDQEFGRDETYGIFVRSDTNVEDLPGFTGAGLNLTVPNVVGFAKVLEAISQVWASPFTERSYEWRQGHMVDPEHVFVSVLLLKSVPVEKSGVMVSVDPDSGDPGWLSIAVNEGIAGASAGQEAEELRVHLADGKVRLMACATEPMKRIILPEGGLKLTPSSGADVVLTQPEIAQLVHLAKILPERFPVFQGSDGRPTPVDVEFGFLSHRLILFQIRPFVQDIRARRTRLYSGLDRELRSQSTEEVQPDAIPPEE